MKKYNKSNLKSLSVHRTLFIEIKEQQRVPLVVDTFVEAAAVILLAAYTAGNFFINWILSLTPRLARLNIAYACGKSLWRPFSFYLPYSDLFWIFDPARPWITKIVKNAYRHLIGRTKKLSVILRSKIFILNQSNVWKMFIRPSRAKFFKARFFRFHEKS